MWAGLNGFDPRYDLVLGGVRIGTGYMDLVTVISRCMRVPITLTLSTQRMIITEVELASHVLERVQNRITYK